MNSTWYLFLGCSLSAILIQALFALFEMACVSFNKVRLQYFASLGKKRAIWLTELISQPSRLFGTTLIGINASLLIGSECARRFYEALHLNPDFAPLTQVILVVLFGELVPMFAARHHPEQFSMALAPLMMLISKILTPAIWTIELMSKGICRLIGKPPLPIFLTREELQKAFEEEGEAKDEFNALIGRMFTMKNLLARQSMTPIRPLEIISSDANLHEARRQLSLSDQSFLLVYHRKERNVVAILHLRDVLSPELDSSRPAGQKKILEYAKPPWFVTEDATLLQILEQFRRNNQSVAVILNAEGQAIGLLSLDQIIEAFFGRPTSEGEKGVQGGPYIERTISGSMTVEEFNRAFQADLPSVEGDTMSDFLVSRLEHLPVKGESIDIGSYEFTVLEPSLRGAKLIQIVRSGGR
jgi:CBS domain containing-hemolysin-like protein